VKPHAPPVLAAACAALVLSVSACSEAPSPDRLRAVRTVSPTASVSAGKARTTDAAMYDLLTIANRKLSLTGANYRVAVADWITAGNEAGSTVYFANVGNRKLDAHFVPGDPRRIGPGARDEITYLVDVSDGATSSGLSGAETEEAIDAAMDTWAAVRCAPVKIVKVPDPGYDPDIVDALIGFGDFGTPSAQITDAGWVGGVFPPGVLGVTFTIVFTDDHDEPTDIDHNGKMDVAFREIYYGDDFPWNLGTNIDVQSVALHESGHGLSQGHFGALFRTDANGKFHFAPLAVMNAGYTQVQQELSGTDIAGHCAVWASWPN